MFRNEEHDEQNSDLTGPTNLEEEDINQFINPNFFSDTQSIPEENPSPTIDVAKEAKKKRKLVSKDKLEKYKHRKNQFIYAEPNNLPIHARLVPQETKIKKIGTQYFADEKEVIKIACYYAKKYQTYYFSDNGEPIPINRMTPEIINQKVLDGRIVISGDAYKKRRFILVKENRDLNLHEKNEVYFNFQTRRLELAGEEVVFPKKLVKRHKFLTQNMASDNDDFVQTSPNSISFPIKVEDLLPSQTNSTANHTEPAFDLSSLEFLTMLNTHTLHPVIHQLIEMNLKQIKELCLLNTSFYQLQSQATFFSSGMHSIDSSEEFNNDEINDLKNGILLNSL